MKPLILSLLLSWLATNQAAAQTPDAIVSSFFQALNQPTTITGTLQKEAIKSKPSRELTPMLMFAKANWDALSQTTQAMVNPWLARPDDNIGSPPNGVSFYAANQVISTISTTNFVFHYLDAVTYPTDPNRADATFVQQLATFAEAVWAQEINTMGYSAPPADSGLGGDNKYDIYLLNTGGVGIYGYVTSNAQTYLGSPFPRSLYSHMVIDNDFAGFPQAPQDAAKATLAHEFFHSIQFGYDPSEFAAFSESTATWMEDKVYPTIKDNLQYIGEPFTDSNGDGQYTTGEPFTDRNGNNLRESGSQDYPELPLDAFGRTPSGLEQYGRFMWVRYLSDKHGDALIKSILTNTGQTAGNNTYAAIDAALQTKGSSLAAAFHEWGIWNIDTSKYQNGADYPMAWVDKLVQGGINISNDSATVLQQLGGKQPHLSTVYERVQNPIGTFTFTSPGSALVSVMTQTTLGGAYTTTNILLTGGQGSWTAPAGIAMATFVISNTSPTDNTMTWKLSDGTTPAMPTLMPTGPVYSDTSGGISGNTNGSGTDGNTTTASSSSSGGCISAPTPYFWWYFTILSLLLFRRKGQPYS